MSLETGSVSAESVTHAMDVISRGTWRRVKTDAKVNTGRNKRAKFTVIGAAGKLIEIDMPAHSSIRARPTQLADTSVGQDGEHDGDVH